MRPRRSDPDSGHHARLTSAERRIDAALAELPDSCDGPEPSAAVFDNFARRALTGAIGEPQQIAAAHLYLMQNQFVTGTVLTVDAGATA